MVVSQVDDGSYVHQLALLTLLRENFGDDFKVSVKGDHVHFLIPRQLNVEEITLVSSYSVERTKIESSAWPHFRVREEVQVDNRGKETKPVIHKGPQQSVETKSPPAVTPIEFSNGRFIVHANKRLEVHDGMLAACTIEFPFERPEAKANMPTISGYLHASGVVSKGQTCTVYGIRASVSYNYNRDDREQGETTKMAIKRLSKESTPEHFFREYEILKSVEQGCHTNIVQIIKGFSDVEDDEISDVQLLIPVSLRQSKAALQE